jgi:hypothetical protein
MKSQNTSSNRCKGILGFIFGHNFQPRYTATEITNDPIIQAVTSVKEMVAQFRSSGTTSRDEYVISEGFKVIKHALSTTNNKGSYVKDICRRCGVEKGLFFNVNPPVPRQLDSDL